ncbi:MAG: hypothetical protein BGO82_14235 [Devosia sp. 67-54]|nr:flagellar hook-length control protein FliK [Stenotrophomonas acidaminiphila]OJX16034.1 MAG: hypothetical protein BGO82_14235 [Devosia sp. 67-54]
MHRCRWRIPSTEVELSTHLTIAYTGPSTTSGSTAPGGGVATSASGSAQDANPLGFLAALVDQLLTGSAAQATTTSATSGNTIGAPSTSNLLDVQARKATGAPGPNVLLAQLAAELKTLQQQVANGGRPDPQVLQKLGDTADALAALIGTPSPTATATSPAATFDPLAALKGGKSNAPSTDGPQADAKPATAPSDQIAQLLASLGIQLPIAPTTTADTDTASSASAATAPPLPAIAQLASQISELGTAIAASAPDIAQKLAALTQKLNGAEADPTVLAQLTTPDDTGATTLDTIVRSLLDAKPTTAATSPTPQIAASTQLQAPPTVATGTQSATLDPPPQPTVSAPAAATSRPAKTAEATKPADNSHDDAVKAEAKVIAATTTQADAKSDPTGTTQPNANAVGAPAAQASPRILPAAYQAAATPINMAQVAFEMMRQMHQGQSRFSIRIDPPELGRVDVKMHVDASGNINARLTVERSETLDMFQRDRGSLEKALSQAGLDGAKTNLEFSLRQNPFAGMMGGDRRPDDGNSSGSRFALAPDSVDDAIASSAIPSVTLYRGVASAGGVNLFV